jgi:serine/threonine-protein kinase
MAGNTDYTGQTLDNRYQVIELLGQGGMGSVYRGRHSVIGRKLAVKFLHSEFATSEEVLKRFYREAQAAAAIGHKNIIEVIDVGASPEGDPYLVMEYLEGEDIETMLQRAGTLDLAGACGVLEPVLRALGAAHDKGIVHRDLKPANIFVTQPEGEDPTVKLIDFGISKFVGSEDQTKLTQTGALIGTPAYMSPEQARGTGGVDHRTDLYAVGVILYQMLTGELPFKGESYNDLLIRVLTEDHVPPTEVRPDFPAEAEPVIAKALAKDPARRYQSADEMLSALEALAAYASRRDSFDLLVSGIRTRTAVVGDLGSKISNGTSSSATDVLAKMQAGATPTGWAGTSPAKPARNKLLLAVGGAAALVIAVVVVIAVVASGEDEVERPAIPPPMGPLPGELAGPDQGVEIRVEGAPEGAKIFYGEAPVPMNPFRVEEAATLKALKVLAEGYEPFVTSVIPSEDRVVEVALTPVVVEPEVEAETEDETEEVASKGSKKGKKGKDARKETEEKPPQKTVVITETAPPPVAPPKKKEPPPKKKEPPPKKKEPTKKISEGGKGTLYSEDFD